MAKHKIIFVEIAGFTSACLWNPFLLFVKRNFGEYQTKINLIFNA